MWVAEMSGRKHSEAEAILARQRKINNQRRWRDANKEQIRARYRNGQISNRPNQCNSIWTPERHAELVVLFEENLTAAEIGRRMRLTKNTIIGRLNRCGLRRRGEYTGPTSMERLKAINAEWAKRNKQPLDWPEELDDAMDSVILATRKENWSRMN